jgi:superoxide reductase
MNDRRDFLKTTAAAVSVMALTNAPLAFASGSAEYKNIIFTKDDPGKWTGKEGIHAPMVTVAGNKVTVATTKHPMSESHFIVRHTLVLGDGTFVGATTFTPTDKPESTYDLPSGYKGKISATSFCNLHDFWLTDTAV